MPRAPHPQFHSRRSRSSLRIAVVLLLCATGIGFAGETAALTEPYENPVHQAVPFGRHSYFLAPWRSYMDTWPAMRYHETLGITMNTYLHQVEPAAAVLAEAGIRQARVEFGWNSVRFDRPDTLTDAAAQRFAATLRALRKHGIRPLLLLNANSGAPCPHRDVAVALLKDASPGDRILLLESVDGIKPHFTGLNEQAYQRAFPLIVKVTATTPDPTSDDAAGTQWRCELSAPLRKAIPAGTIKLSTLRYHPFGGTVFEGGKANPDAEETFNGWLQYVKAVTDAAKDALGTGGTNDAGFDLEVWNEYTFGSHFLDERHYYQPSRAFEEPFVYRNHGRVQKGHEAILPMTVDWVNDPANGLPGVRVISGFSNQRPWECGRYVWPGQAGFSRHYYTGSDRKEISRAAHIRGRTSGIEGPVDALGRVDGEPDGKDWHTITPSSLYVPEHVVAMPEFGHYAYRTEFMTRDLQPFPGPWSDHYRYGHPGTGRPAEVWMTETNWYRKPFAMRLRELAGCEKTDPRYKALMHHVGAKAVLRTFVFCGHKGVETITLFAAKGEDDGFAVLPEAFFARIDAAKGKLTDAARAETGPQLAALARVTDLMQTGRKIDVARKLRVDRVVEHDPRPVFEAEGTAERPHRWHRDDLAILPFQLNVDTFAIGIYVVTRDMTRAWQPDREPLDPLRYDMPPQIFDVTFANLRGDGATLSVLDPITGETVAAEALASGAAHLVVRLPVTDYPRFLVIKEAAPGPLVENVRIKRGDRGLAMVHFTTPVPATARVEWGPHPRRNAYCVMHERTATEHRVQLHSLHDDDAIRITCVASERSAVWPQWNWDTRGIAGFDGSRPEGLAEPVLSLPSLGAHAVTASGYTGPFADLTPGRTDRVTLGGVSVAVTREADAMSIETLARTLGLDDRRRAEDVSVIRWGGLPAWRIVTRHDGTLRWHYVRPVGERMLHCHLSAVGDADPAGAEAFLEATSFTAQGLRATYYQDRDLDVPVVTRVDSRIDFDWGNAPPLPDFRKDNFAVRWEGQLVPRYSETYTVFAGSDDGIRVWVGERQIVDNWKTQGFREVEGRVPLEAGVPVPIRVEYLENGGRAAVRLSWSSESQAKEPIPAECFRCALDDTIIDTAPVTAKPSRQPDFAPAVGLLPALPKQPRPATVDTGRLRKEKWRKEGEKRVLTLDGATVSLSITSLPETRAEDLLPRLAPQDTCAIETVTWNGAAAWSVRLSLEPAAHPGHVNLYQHYLIAPLAEGTLVLSISGAKGRLAQHEAAFLGIADRLRFAANE